VLTSLLCRSRQDGQGTDTGRTTPADDDDDLPDAAAALAALLDPDACPPPVLVVGAAAGGGAYLRLGRGAVVGTDVLPSLLGYVDAPPWRDSVDRCAEPY
jgi:hypothetical protein